MNALVIKTIGIYCNKWEVFYCLQQSLSFFSLRASVWRNHWLNLHTSLLSDIRRKKHRFSEPAHAVRTALPLSFQISWASLWQPFFFPGECKAVKPHCRAVAIQTNNVAIMIAILATISPVLLSTELSHLCLKWDRLSNRQMAQNQNSSFLLDKLFAYVGRRCYAGKSLAVMLNDLLLFI